MAETPSPQPSTGYSLSLIVAALGVTCTALALTGVLYLRGGRDPVEAAGLPGQIAFAASFGLLFATRLIFSPARSQAFKRTVRSAISGVLATELTLALVAAAMVLSSDAPGLFLGIVLTLALACQAGTLAWLFRFRTE